MLPININNMLQELFDLIESNNELSELRKDIIHDEIEVQL